MNGLPTYDVPPVPTLQGLLYAAMGRPSLLRPNSLNKDVRDQEESFRARVEGDCDFAIRVLAEGTTLSSLRKRQKATESGDAESYVGYPAEMETLIAPTYRIYVGGPDDLLSAFQSVLDDPVRMLYLGRSDDLVDIRDVDVTTAELVEEEAQLDCVIPGGGNEVNLLPIEPDRRAGRTTQPGRVATVSVSGGTVDSYYETEDEMSERFVYVT